MSLASPLIDEILGFTKERVARSKENANLRWIEESAQNHRPRGFRKSLAARHAAGPAIIAELKKASPSKGIFRSSFPVAVLADELAKAGAAALSVVTEERFFHGSLANLLQASMVTGLPCLCKDFIVEEFQIIEAKAHHADAVLLIMSALTDREFRRFLSFAGQLGLDVLCEVHDEDELKRALDGGAQIIGVNSRDLRTFDVSLNRLLEIAAKIVPAVMRVAESGISEGAEIRKLHDCGYHAFLIGEALMRSNRPGQKLEQLLQETGLNSIRMGVEAS
jgi:indole-3-glycerol phosphate synthase